MSMDAQRPSAISAAPPATGNTIHPSTARTVPAAATARPPRANALRHGLTAATLVDRLVGEEAYYSLVASLTEEFGAQTAAEQALVRRIAHHLLALDLAGCAELAALREGLRRHDAFGQVGPSPAAAPTAETERAAGLESNVAVTSDPAAGSRLSAELVEAPLCSAVSSEVLDRVLRYGRTHERGLLATLSQLRELVVSRQRPPLSQPLSPPASATAPAGLLVGRPVMLDELAGDDAACEQYLLDRLRSASYRCPSCGAAHGYWLVHRRRWECSRCRKQAGARTGTVMSGSQLRLSIWFQAIGLLLWQPEMPAAEVAAALGIRRLATVRRIVRKVRASLVSPDRSRLLAGLDEWLAAQLAPATSAPIRGILRNGTPQTTADLPANGSTS